MAEIMDTTVMMLEGFHFLFLSDALQQQPTADCQPGV